MPRAPRPSWGVMSALGWWGEDHHVDLAVVDAAGVGLVAGVDLAAVGPDGFAFVAVGFAGDDGHRAASVVELGVRVGSQVEVPAGGPGVAETGADDRDLVARRHAD